MLPPNKGPVLKCGACPWRSWSMTGGPHNAGGHHGSLQGEAGGNIVPNAYIVVCYAASWLFDILWLPLTRDILRSCIVLGWLLKACCSTSLIPRRLLHLDSPRQCFWPRSFKTLFILQVPQTLAFFCSFLLPLRKENEVEALGTCSISCPGWYFVFAENFRVPWVPWVSLCCFIVWFSGRIPWVLSCCFIVWFSRISFVFP